MISASILLWGIEYDFDYTIEQDAEQDGEWPWFNVTVSTEDKRMQKECGNSFSFRVSSGRQVLVDDAGGRSNLKRMVANKILSLQAAKFNGAVV